MLLFLHVPCFSPGWCSLLWGSALHSQAVFQFLLTRLRIGTCTSGKATSTDMGRMNWFHCASVTTLFLHHLLWCPGHCTCMVLGTWRLPVTVITWQHLRTLKSGKVKTLFKAGCCEHLQGQVKWSAWSAERSFLFVGRLDHYLTLNSRQPLTLLFLWRVLHSLDSVLHVNRID